MLVETLSGEAARRSSVVARLKNSALPSDVAVLTGGFSRRGCVPDGFVVAAHARVNTTVTRWTENGNLIGGMLVSRGLGQLAIERTSDFVARNESEDHTIQDALQSKPILVMNGADDRVKEDEPSNRMAIGLTSSGEIVIVGAVRSGWSALSLQEMVKLLLIPESANGPGAVSAINLEGADAQLYIPALDRYFAEDSPTCVPTQLHFRTPIIPKNKRPKGLRKK